MSYLPCMDSEDPVGDEEQFQSIPWSTLTMDAGRPPWLVYVAAGAVVALVVGVLLARSFGSASALPVPAASTQALSPINEERAVPTAVEEADLRALYQPGTGEEQLIMATAESFVRSYFTTDEAGDRSAAVARDLGWPAPVASGPLTYVEWARAWEVTDPVDGRYRVSVSFRTISDSAGEYRRGPVMAVDVLVQITPGGETYVVDLPSPAELPVRPANGPKPSPLIDVPEEIVAGVLRTADTWGMEPSVVGGTEVDGGWRVVVEVEDPAGARWPLVVHVAEDRGP